MTIFDDTARRNMGEHGSSYDTMGPNVFRFEEFQAALRPHYSKATTVAEWEVEYDEYCASLEAEAYEAVNDNGFIMYLQPAEHHKGTPSQVAAERGVDARVLDERLDRAAARLAAARLATKRDGGSRWRADA